MMSGWGFERKRSWVILRYYSSTRLGKLEESRKLWIRIAGNWIEILIYQYSGTTTPACSVDGINDSVIPITTYLTCKKR